MLRMMMAVLSIVSLAAVDSADAAGKRKRQKVRQLARIAAPYGTTPRPVWAQPGECFTDEGSGRYTSCSTGKDD